MLTLRVTREDRELLAKIVEQDAAQQSLQGTEVTAASVVRGLIRREAVLRGLLSAPGQKSSDETTNVRLRKKRR